MIFYENSGQNKKRLQRTVFITNVFHPLLMQKNF